MKCALGRALIARQSGRLNVTILPPLAPVPVLQRSIRLEDSIGRGNRSVPDRLRYSTRLDTGAAPGDVDRDWVRLPTESSQREGMCVSHTQTLCAKYDIIGSLDSLLCLQCITGRETRQVKPWTGRYSAAAVCAQPQESSTTPAYRVSVRVCPHS